MLITIKVPAIRLTPTMQAAHQALLEKDMETFQAALAECPVSQWISVYTQYIIQQVWFSDTQGRGRFADFLSNLFCNALLNKTKEHVAQHQEKQRLLERYRVTQGGFAAEGTVRWNIETQSRHELAKQIKLAEADLELFRDQATSCFALIPLIVEVLEEKIEAFDVSQVKAEMLANPKPVIVNLIKMILSIQRLNASQTDTEQDNLAEFFTVIKQILTVCGIDSASLSGIQFKTACDQKAVVDIPSLILMIQKRLELKGYVSVQEAPPEGDELQAACALDDSASPTFPPLTRKVESLSDARLRSLLPTSLGSFPSVLDLSTLDLSEKATLLPQFQVVITRQRTHRRSLSDGLLSTQKAELDATTVPNRTVSAVPVLSHTY